MHEPLPTWTALVIGPASIVAFVFLLVMIRRIEQGGYAWRKSVKTTLKKTESLAVDPKPFEKLPVRLASISAGADFEFDLSFFPEPTPTFAYVDDLKNRFEVLHNLTHVGAIVIEDRPDYMWLYKPRRCVLLKATEGADIAAVRSLGYGEFCLEIYHIVEGEIPSLLYQNDFCFK